MTAEAVRSLRDLRLGDAPLVGGKAAGLGELLATNTRVPDGFVLTTLGAGLPVAERSALVHDAARALGDGPFAVRSSGVAEDGFERSFAGAFETVLDVPLAEVAPAVERVLVSGRSDRAERYAGGVDQAMAVIVQRLIRPRAAGVVFTADPVSGDRDAVVITAVRGSGDQLVSGTVLGDEWVVRDGVATVRRQPERAISEAEAGVVAGEARRIAAARGTPQDIEWAIDADARLWILQARPMTALPPDVSWEAPAPGAYARSMRFGEWIAEPVTPLFESWLLTTMEDSFHARLMEEIGQYVPRPYHVVVNGWYFYTLNWISVGALARSLPTILPKLLRQPRRLAGALPQTVRHSDLRLFEREWREGLRPRYRAAVSKAEDRVDSLPASELPALIDELASVAGEHFLSIAALAGAAYKTEINLAAFYRRHLMEALGGSHLPLLAGFDMPAEPDRHAVASLDWWHAPAPAGTSAVADQHARVVETRQAAEAAAFEVLGPTPRRLRSFRRLLAESQYLIPIRDEQVRELTIAWPVMRRAVMRIGEALVAQGVVATPDDVFFLTRDEALDLLAGGRSGTTVDVAARRSERDEQARLVAPLFVGRLGRLRRRMLDDYRRYFGGSRSDRALVSGWPASPGRATGPVRVIRGPHQFDELLPGEILVAPLTAPAWTPLFATAAAVVTDVGSAAAHASIIAREYGIPAVVGCGDATARLRTGMRVTVDGTTGNVEPA
jgi:phosphohistidine swiveling domain-containing protein